jgi:hypothetical protein
MGGTEMTTNNPQAPWTDEQWARANQVIQEEASRARVAATFLPLIGPLPGSTDFVRQEVIRYQPVPPPPPQQIGIDDRNIRQLATATGEGARAWRPNGTPGYDQRHEAREGEGRAVLVGGEPGVGKSRLTQALCEQIADESPPFCATCAFTATRRKAGWQCRLGWPPACGETRVGTSTCRS